VVEIGGIIASEDLMALERRRLRGRFASWTGFLAAVAAASLRARIGRQGTCSLRITVEERDFSLTSQVGDCLDLIAIACR
jgi:hypothetical protein